MIITIIIILIYLCFRSIAHYEEVVTFILSFLHYIIYSYIESFLLSYIGILMCYGTSLLSILVYRIHALGYLYLFVTISICISYLHLYLHMKVLSHIYVGLTLELINNRCDYYKSQHLLT